MAEEKPTEYIDLDFRKAKKSDIPGMHIIFDEDFKRRNPQLALLMCGKDPFVEPPPLCEVVHGILRSYLDHPDCRFMVAYDTSEDELYEHSMEDTEVAVNCETDTKNREHMSYLTFGWISASITPPYAFPYDYLISEFDTVACLRELQQARVNGEDQTDIDEPRSRLLRELMNRSMNGQAVHIHGSHLVINGLFCWPTVHAETYWEMTEKLLTWAVKFAERRCLPVWSQIPENQEETFHRAGFKKVESFTLDLNDYRPEGSAADWQEQEWVQMMHNGIPRGRIVRSKSPENRGGRSKKWISPSDRRGRSRRRSL